MIDPGRLLARDFASMLLDIVPDAPCNDDTFACSLRVVVDYMVPVTVALGVCVAVAVVVGVCVRVKTTRRVAVSVGPGVGVLVGRGVSVGVALGVGLTGNGSSGSAGSLPASISS